MYIESLTFKATIHYKVVSSNNKTVCYQHMENIRRQDETILQSQVLFNSCIAQQRKTGFQKLQRKPKYNINLEEVKCRMNILHISYS
jgi:hypothetical protein